MLVLVVPLCTCAFLTYGILLLRKTLLERFRFRRIAFHTIALIAVVALLCASFLAAATIQLKLLSAQGKAVLAERGENVPPFILVEPNGFVASMPLIGILLGFLCYYFVRRHAAQLRASPDGPSGRR